MTDTRQRAWLEVDPSVIESNTRYIRNYLSDSCSLMAVVKADGYGHGAQTVARAALLGGAKNLGVATLQEGIELRKSGLDCPILVLGNLIDKKDFGDCLHWDLMPTVSSIRGIKLCEDLAKDTGRKFGIHLKIDTGLTRLGCDLNEVLDLLVELQSFENVNLKGVYSHLALADCDSQSQQFTYIQQKRFEEALCHFNSNLKDKVDFHLANSAGTFRDSRLHYDMVRVGLAIYGYNPINNSFEDINLKPALSVKARVTFLRNVATGVGVSYGHQFRTERPSKLAVLGIGYADGINRSLSGKISVIVKGKKVPQIGSITMDQLLLDITDHPEVKVGSVVTLLGRHEDLTISPNDWSKLIGSIPWEVLCGFKNRLPRLII